MRKTYHVTILTKDYRTRERRVTGLRDATEYAQNYPNAVLIGIREVVTSEYAWSMRDGKWTPITYNRFQSRIAGRDKGEKKNDISST